MVKPEEGEQELVAINDAPSGGGHALHSEAMMRNIKVEIDLADALPQVVINKVQIQQVVVNLMMNAAESMLDVSGDKRIVLRSRAAMRCGAGGCVRLRPRHRREELARYSNPSSPQNAQGSAWGFP